MRSLILFVCLATLTAGTGADPEPQKEPTQAVKIHAKNERYNGPGEVAPATNPSDTGTLVIRHLRQLTYYKAAPPEQRIIQVAGALKVPAIDLDKQMLILIRAGDRATGSTLTIETTHIKDSRLVVHWRIVAPKVHRLNQKTHTAGMFLVDRFDGEVVFNPPLAPPFRRDEIRRIVKENPDAEPEPDAEVQPRPPVLVEEYPAGGSDIKVFGHLPSDERMWGRYERTGGIVSVRKYEDCKELPWYSRGSINFAEHLAKSFHVRQINLAQQMVLHVYGGYRPQGLNFTQVESIRKAEGKLLVRIRIGKLPSPRPDQYFLGQVLLTERFDGEIVFERVEGDWLTGKMVKPINTDEFGGSDLKVYNVVRSSGHGPEKATPRVTVAKTEDELWTIFGEDRRDDKKYAVERTFGYGKVDMKTQMVLRVTAGSLPREGYRLKVVSLKIVDSTLVLKAELTEDTSSEGSLHRSQNPGELLLVEKFDGPIRLAPIDDQATMKHKLAGSSRVAILGQGVLHLPATAFLGKKEFSGYADRKIRWAANDPKRVGDMLNMKPEAALDLVVKALRIDTVDFEKQTLLFLANGVTADDRNYSFFGGRRIQGNVFGIVADQAFVPYRNELFVYYRIENKPATAEKKEPRLPIQVLLIERYGGYLRFEEGIPFPR